MACILIIYIVYIMYSVYVDNIYIYTPNSMTASQKKLLSGHSWLPWCQMEVLMYTSVVAGEWQILTAASTFTQISLFSSAFGVVE